MTKICLFSDTHTYHQDVEIPECDIAIFAGDMSFTGKEKEVFSFFSWYSDQHQAKHKIAIAGNHDLCFDPRKNGYDGLPGWVNDLYNDCPNVLYLENESVKLEGLNIWGSPITPDFYPEHWAFNKSRGEKINKVWSKIPLNTDILVTHGPVYGHLDYVAGLNVGCEDLRNRILEVRPKLSVCGHIHEGYGIKEVDGIIYANASVLDGQYKHVNEVIVIDL